MLNALKKLFGIKAQEKAQTAPYKVETPKVEEFPFPNQSAAKPATKPAAKKTASRPAKIQGDKKPAVKAKTARKPKTPKV